MDKTVRERVVELVEYVCSLDPDQVALLARDETHFADDLGIDFFEFATVVVECEEKFGIMIPDEEDEACRTVGGLVACIERLVAAKTVSPSS